MKIIKFDLPINGTKVKNLDELRDNLTDEILTLARSSQLERWLKTRQLPEQAQAVATAVRSEGTDKGLFLALCRVLEVEAHPDDVKAIFDAPPAPGRFISGARYREELKNRPGKKFENEEVVFLKKIVKLKIGEGVVVECSNSLVGRSSVFFGSVSVVDIHVNEGEIIKKDDLLFEIKDLFGVNKIFSSLNGVVQKVFVKVGKEIKPDQYLMSIAEIES